jgi:hypothetical protein
MLVRGKFCIESQLLYALRQDEKENIELSCTRQVRVLYCVGQRR